MSFDDSKTPQYTISRTQTSSEVRCFLFRFQEVATKVTC